MGRAIDGVKGREWEERLRRYADSQLTVGEFCVWEGVSVAAFYVWRKKLASGQTRRRTTGSPATAEGASGSIGLLSRESFLPVRVAERSVATAGVTTPPVNNPRRTRCGDTVPATTVRIEARLTNGVCFFVSCTDGGRVMLTCPTHLPIYFCTTPVDFRKSFDGLTGVITAVFGSSVLDSHLFLFINKRRDP